MALNIKNDRVVALAREASDRTGRTQVSVMEEALRRYLTVLDEESAAADARERRRRADIKDAVRRLQESFSDEDRATMRREMDDMYDDDGLPR